MARANAHPPEDPADKTGGDDRHVQQVGGPVLPMQETTEWLVGSPQDSGAAVSHEAALDALDSVRDADATPHG